MSIHVSGDNISQAWLQSYEALSAAPKCETVNLTVTVKSPGLELTGLRKAVDTHVAELRAAGKSGYDKSIHTVANTIFPISLYREGNVDGFYEAAIRAQSHRDGTITSWGPKAGTYIGRLLSYPTYGGEQFNQLARMLENLDLKLNYQDCYELSTTCEPPDSSLENPSLFTSASTFVPNYDNSYRGGQCLSHISLHCSPAGELSMTALYRHQTYLSRAYGNFLGLSRLLHFLVRESRKDLTVGELMVVASHAEIESNARARRKTLIAECNHHLDDEPEPIEWQTRPFGSRWSDLDLPIVSS